MALCRGQRAKPLIIDPGLYLSTKKDIFWATEKRGLPTAFKLFTGESYATLQILRRLIIAMMCIKIDMKSFTEECSVKDWNRKKLDLAHQ